MNYQHLQEIIDHYIALFPETNNNIHREYYKWQIAYDFRPMMDEALAASDAEFPNKLYAIRKRTENLIDSRPLPFYGLVEFSKKEPETVRDMFLSLFKASQAEVKDKQTAIHNFLDRSHKLREKYFPDSPFYRDDLHSVTGYLFLYDPDHNYMYKATHCRKFADCIEFFTDWGAGENTKLDIFFRMCDEALAAIKESDVLMATAAGRYDKDPGRMHPDTEKHILLFDLIYCCSTYNLFKGIHFVEPKSAERQLIQALKEKAVKLEQALNEAQEKAARLNDVRNIISEAVVVGKTVTHKTFGAGKIVSVDGEHLFISFESIGVKELAINSSIANGFITMEGVELSHEQVDLLKNAKRFSDAVRSAEKNLAPYIEYLE